MKPEKIYKIKVSVTGFTKAQVEEGLPELLNEFKQRPWMFETQAYWEDSTKKLITIVGYDLDISLEERAFDEVWDCVIATMQFDEKISFDIQRI